MSLQDFDTGRTCPHCSSELELGEYKDYQSLLCPSCGTPRIVVFADDGTIRKSASQEIAPLDSGVLGGSSSDE
ncbi:MAG: hypothetical protein U5K37_08570 [Natrialbaceae archaeon]|nr:hypothetical protein [Natrialbaceae archaeon]